MTDPPSANAPAPAVRDERRTWITAGLSAAVVAFLPFVRGVGAGSSFFFRDLSRFFIPVRLFVLEGLRQGELRFWNPYDHEGTPLALLPLAYPLELLQVLWPTPAGITLFMALHFPLAAFAFVVLARHLGVRPVAAAGGAVAYAIGGFSLSMVNLYIYVPALAWAPLVVWGLLRAAEGGGRRLAAAAVLCGVAFTTAGIEVVLQAVMVSAVLCFRSGDPRRPTRVANGVVLGLALAAPACAVLERAMGGSARSAGFSPDAVLNQSVHPLTFLQVVVGDLYGRLPNITNDWWGGRFFENGFPYVMSLYLGATTLALAAAGLASRRPYRGRLAAIGLVAVIVCLGRWIGWMTILELVPASFRIFRYPTKAFFSIHLVTALLAAYGLDALARSDRRALGVLRVCASAGALLLLPAPALTTLMPGAIAWFQAALPAGGSAAAAAATAGHVLGDAARGGVFVLGAAVLASLVRSGRLPGARGALCVAALVTVDLLRTGANLNPTIDVRLFQAAPEMTRLVDALQPVRVHTCELFESPAYWTARGAQPNRHVVFTFLAMRDSLYPHFHLAHHVQSALGEDLIGLVPRGQTANGQTCAGFEEMADRLREAAVTHVISVEPLTSPELQPVSTFTSPALAPAVVHVYSLRDPRPRFALSQEGGSVRVVAEHTDAVTLDVTAPADGALLVRDGFSEGWRATLDGRPLAIAEHQSHRLLAMPAGAHRVEMRYRAPGLVPGIVAAALSAAVLVVLCLRREPATG